LISAKIIQLISEIKEKIKKNFELLVVSLRLNTTGDKKWGVPIYSQAHKKETPNDERVSMCNVSMCNVSMCNVQCAMVQCVMFNAKNMRR